MRINDKVFVHTSDGDRIDGTVKAIVGAGTSGYKALFIATEAGDVGSEKAGVPHFHDREDSDVYWTQTHEQFDE